MNIRFGGWPLAQKPYRSEFEHVGYSCHAGLGPISDVTWGRPKLRGNIVMHEPLTEGMRVGRFVILRDIDGRTHAIAAGSIPAICETDEGALVLLPGGKLLHVPRPMEVILEWFDGKR